jgi:hypothetical protein
LYAENAVSSPPIVISRSTPSESSDCTVFSSLASSLVGFARAMPRIEPPRKWMRETDSIVSGIVWVVSLSMIQRKPSRTPTTSAPERHARIVAAPITELMPGAGPPPTRMATFFWLTRILLR